MTSTGSRVESLVRRHYTTQGGIEEVFSGVEWENRVTEVRSSGGEVVFSNRAEGGFEVPKFWSQLAGNIVAEKYARKAGCKNLTEGRESSLKQIVTRVVRTISNLGESMGYLRTLLDKADFEAELAYMIVHQIGAFNSPVWFNVGLDMWGCTGGGGNYQYRPETGVRPSPNDYSAPQASACFILAREDSLQDIFQGVQEETQIFKYGSGAGSNFSKIRSRHEKLSSGGYSSGLLSFLKVYDAAAGSTKSGGTTRRAAKMVILNEDHPEILDFIRWKMNEEKKAQALIAAGYESNFNGEAYSTVGGQNGNNTVRVTDDFMRKAVSKVEKASRLYPTVMRTNGNQIHEHLDASEVLDEMAKAAWACGCPGIQYDDQIQKWNTVPSSGRIEATNPCSEFVFIDDTACNLASLNLLKFVAEEGQFDYEAYRHACRVFLLAQEILVELSSYPTPEIAENSYKFRPLGLGYANLGALLFIRGYPYGSVDAQDLTSKLTGLMTAHAYKISSEMAEIRGAGWFYTQGTNKESTLRVLKQHQEAWGEMSDNPFNFVDTFGIRFRNSQVTVLAPTGTIGLMMDCYTTGVEPVLSFAMKKELAGGGVTYIVLDDLVRRGLSAWGYTPEKQEEILRVFKEKGYPGSDCLTPTEISSFRAAMSDGLGFSLSPRDHLTMMAAAQPFLSGAISKTVNLPNSCTWEDVRDTYVEGWRLNLKAVAIYRDGCKLSQPITSTTTQKKEEAPVPVLPTAAPAALSTPDTRRRIPSVSLGKTDRFAFSIAGQKFYLHVGLSDEGAPLEIFLRGPKMGNDLISMLDCWCVAVSQGLQAGVSPTTYLDSFTFIRFNPGGPVQGHPTIKFASSVVDMVWRIIGVHYLKRTEFAHVEDVAAMNSIAEEQNPDLHETVILSPTPQGSDAPFCSNCGHRTFRNGACYRCLNCGNSEGCS